MRLGMMLYAMAVILTGCGLSGHRQSGELIQKLIGQEIHFSDTLLLSTREWMQDSLRRHISEPRPKILVGITSQECNICQMHLPEWNVYIRKLNRRYGNIPLVFVIAEEPGVAVGSVRSGHCPALVLSDPTHTFWRENELPASPVFNTFLLDGDNRVVLVGSPIGNPKLQDLYERTIARLNAGSDSMDGAVVLSN